MTSRLWRAARRRAQRLIHGPDRIDIPRELWREGVFLLAGRFRETLSVRWPAGTFVVSTRDYDVSRRTFVSGPYGLERLLRVGGLVELGGREVLEIGANIGTTTVPLVTVLNAARVHACEPVTRNLDAARAQRPVQRPARSCHDPPDRRIRSTGDAQLLPRRPLLGLEPRRARGRARHGHDDRRATRHGTLAGARLDRCRGTRGRGPRRRKKARLDPDRDRARPTSARRPVSPAQRDRAPSGSADRPGERQARLPRRPRNNRPAHPALAIRRRTYAAPRQARFQPSQPCGASSRLNTCPTPAGRESKQRARPARQRASRDGGSR